MRRTLQSLLSFIQSALKQIHKKRTLSETALKKKSAPILRSSPSRAVSQEFLDELRLLVQGSKRIGGALLVLGALTGLSPRLFAGDAGTSSFDALRIDLGARAAAMGGALSAVRGDIDAMQYNPALLSTLEKRQVTFMHNNYFDDITQQYLSLGLTNGWGFWVNHLDLGSFQKTTVSDPTGASLSELDASDNAVSLSYAREIRPGISIGGSAKYVEETLGNVKGNATALDIGALARLERLGHLNVAVAAQNIGSNARFDSEREKLPLLVRLGASHERELFKQHLLVAIDLTHQTGEGFDVSLGSELMMKNLDLRVGFKSRNETDIGMTAGAGFRFREKYRLDYAFVPFGDLGNSHRISLSLKF